MSMKKKFLALALAGAVAMPVVANATNTKVESTDASKDLNTDVTIEGTVLNDTGLAPQGKIQVELPSTMAFSVDKAGKFTTATNYKITNQSSTEGIDVYVTGFSEQIIDGGIKIDDYDTISNALNSTSRSTVGLKLTGDAGKTAKLKTNMSETQIFDNIAAGQFGNMTLEGIAGTKVNSAPNGASENFTVNFKISKNS